MGPAAFQSSGISAEMLQLLLDHGSVEGDLSTAPNPAPDPDSDTIFDTTVPKAVDHTS